MIARDFILYDFLRNSLAIASIVLAISMITSMASLIIGFESTVTNWIGKIIHADIYITKDDGLINKDSFPLELISELKQLNTDLEVDFASFQDVLFDKEVVSMNGAYDFINSDKYVFKEFLNSKLESQAYINESFSRHLKYKIGQEIKIKGKEFLITGINADYQSDKLSMIIDWKDYQSLFPNALPQVISLKGQSYKQNLDKLEKLGEKYVFNIIENESLRSDILSVFHQTFLLTKLILIISFILVIVTFCVNSRLIVQENKSQLRNLKAIGIAKSDFIKVTRALNFHLTFIVLILSVILSIALTLFIFYGVNYNIFGWSIEYYFSWKSLLACMLTLYCMQYLFFKYSQYD